MVVMVLGVKKGRKEVQMQWLRPLGVAHFLIAEESLKEHARSHRTAALFFSPHACVYESTCEVPT